MPQADHPCLNIAIAPLTSAAGNHFAIWVLQAPYLGGHVHHDCPWTDDLAQTWQAWQQLFSLEPIPSPLARSTSQNIIERPSTTQGPATNYSSLLMQKLGLGLWQWLFSGPIQRSFAQSQGIAMGQKKPLRLRLELRDPHLMGLPWEIIQPQLGKPAISLSQRLLFTRTTSDVEALSYRLADRSVNILLVLGQESAGINRPRLDLEKEAIALAEIFARCGQLNGTTPYRVTTLIQPTPSELSQHLETVETHIFLYAGHGVPAPDGGRLFLRSDTTLGGTELAQVLVRAQVTLAVFNSCWGAQCDRHDLQSLPRSSLAEVLVHHGVPAVLAMRDTIADREALSFIEAFAKALAEQHSIDRAVSLARQQLLTLYKFNQPAWTLPVLYMHPEFDGCLIPMRHFDSSLTELPSNSNTRIGQPLSSAYLRLVGGNDKTWPVRAGLMRVGRTAQNDLTVAERWVSKHHAEIFYRNLQPSGNNSKPAYFLRDVSRYGTLVLNAGTGNWQKVHRQEIPLTSGMQFKFGSSQGQTWEFAIEE
ncbi:CHAT domain-containing protein [Oscillatoriales cyanobacterium LEGE 11467]|uniref:CHAT domain-containing protein n=1 Tax=Zarconia navalis LEGE 11467 TaxID=1828826 RepID=A0A928W179_9CYAN|nr:CHAT domain-containing protein [Zarconia navalis]MBE9041400.1 CHAT domain-containing protein [Zarconia navalis LEGE 11467]